MTCQDSITCFHEPFGDAFYYGPERISPAWRTWPAEKIEKSGRSHFTYDLSLQTILEADRVRCYVSMEMSTDLAVGHKQTRVCQGHDIPLSSAISYSPCDCTFTAASHESR